MVPRTDIVGLDVTTTAQELLDRITTVGHSRIPVYEGSADNIIGILYVKDVFRRIARGDRQLELRQFIRPAVFVPETKKVDALLREMQKGKVHIAIVVDEYGGTAGLVTIEDLVEEIVGEIRDEYDVEHELVLPVSENEALMDARIPFEEVRETFGLEVRPTEAYETLGGFVTAQLGRFPRQGESFEAAGARFVVETIDGKRIRRVRVTRSSRARSRLDRRSARATRSSSASPPSRGNGPTPRTQNTRSERPSGRNATRSTAAPTWRTRRTGSRSARNGPPRSPR